MWVPHWERNWCSLFSALFPIQSLVEFVLTFNEYAVVKFEKSEDIPSNWDSLP